jgi:hypothetical protein
VSDVVGSGVAVGNVEVVVVGDDDDDVGGVVLKQRVNESARE